MLKGSRNKGFQRVIGKFLSFGPSRGRGCNLTPAHPKGRAFRSRHVRQRQRLETSSGLLIRRGPLRPSKTYGVKRLHEREITVPRLCPSLGS